jgi:hypothetical protein
MTTFSNGPAAGQVLNLRRAPLFLRLVQDLAGAWDALDQLHDTPRPDETIVVYRLVSNDGPIHLNMRGRQGRRCGGTFQRATYAVVEEQPDDATLRTTASWRQWAQGQAEVQTPAPSAEDLDAGDRGGNHP